jgi:hypothetical protein
MCGRVSRYNDGSVMFDVPLAVIGGVRRVEKHWVTIGCLRVEYCRRRPSGRALGQHGSAAHSVHDRLRSSGPRPWSTRRSGAPGDSGTLRHGGQRAIVGERGTETRDQRHTQRPARAITMPYRQGYRRRRPVGMQRQLSAWPRRGHQIVSTIRPGPPNNAAEPFDASRVWSADERRISSPAVASHQPDRQPRARGLSRWSVILIRGVAERSLETDIATLGSVYGFEGQSPTLRGYTAFARAPGVAGTPSRDRGRLARGQTRSCSGVTAGATAPGSVRARAVRGNESASNSRRRIGNSITKEG